MEPGTGCHVEAEIGVVHPVASTEPRNGMKHCMLQVDRKVEQHDSGDAPAGDCHENMYLRPGARPPEGGGRSDPLHHHSVPPV